ncbi:MAG TPA: glycosyltransferase, partial [Pseudidiomarina sp.]|nr:glycosyltransferase [Pseudidiomarina sp.]
MITLNEERYLDEVLSSVRGADEIVIVDSGSTDD